MLKQQTLKGSFSLNGKGLHTGVKLTVTFNPAPEHYGYKIQRIDLDDQPILDAVAENVVDTTRGTVLAKNGVKVSTVEHALAALYAAGIDNCLIQVDGPEFPILDGSAKAYVECIKRVGIEEQAAPKVINSMKYFCENAPQYHVACAGSLLGIALAKPSSFPVGKVNFMQIDPMTFNEFLLANGDENLAQYLEQVDTLEPIPDAFFNPLYEKLKMYYVTGGMPEPVLMWTEARDVSAMQEALSGIIGAYERDFAKHPDLSEFPKISMIWKSIPSQLARKNKKFIYKVVKEGARAREYEDALQWLVDARLVHKIYRSSAPGLPIAAYDDLSAFKIYLVDVGLLRRLAQLAPTAFGEGNRLFTEFKGALAENFVLQTLITQFEVMPRYWSQNNPPYEVDFLIQRENDIFPVEVKSEANTTSKSMKKFKELFPDKVKLRIRFSLDNLKLDDDVLNIPLFMADQADRLIGLALEQLQK